MHIAKFISAGLIGAAVLLAVPVTATAAEALPSLESFVGAKPTAFDQPDQAVEAFKLALAKSDAAALSSLLGLNAERLMKVDGMGDRIEQMRAAAARLLTVSGEGDLRIVKLGHDVWPFPFPLVKSANDGKWRFDTEAGIQEIVARRIGENELEAISTARLYVTAQRDYATSDHDGDGVLEYAQKIVSTPGQTDGLYWPPEQGDGDSPVGPNLDPSALGKAAEGQGYFGYRFRVLKRQGANIAGGAHDYRVNGNMINGFALIASPVEYGRTGINTFVVNHAGIVYERDFGPGTADIVAKIKTFNPGTAWRVVPD